MRVEQTFLSAGEETFESPLGSRALLAGAGRRLAVVELSRASPALESAGTGRLESLPYVKMSIAGGCGLAI
jgi:hypothetical protein